MRSYLSGVFSNSASFGWKYQYCFSDLEILSVSMATKLDALTLVLMQIEPMKLREMKLDLSRNNYQISPDY